MLFSRDQKPTFHCPRLKSLLSSFWRLHLHFNFHTVPYHKDELAKNGEPTEKVVFFLPSNLQCLSSLLNSKMLIFSLSERVRSSVQTVLSLNHLMLLYPALPLWHKPPAGWQLSRDSSHWLELRTDFHPTWFNYCNRSQYTGCLFELGKASQN